MIYIESCVDLKFDRNKGVKIQVSNKSLTSAGSNLSVVCFFIFVSCPSYWRPFFVRDFLLNGSSSSFSVVVGGLSTICELNHILTKLLLFLIFYFLYSSSR